MQRSHINPEGLADWSWFFTQVVCVEHPGHKQVFIAGQVGVDTERKLVGDGSFETQTAQAFDNLGTALASVGGTFDDVVRLTIYVASYELARASIIGKAIAARFKAGKYPPCTLLGVQCLATPEFQVEVEATAIVAT